MVRRLRRSSDDWLYRKTAIKQLKIFGLIEMRTGRLNWQRERKCEGEHHTKSMCYDARFARMKRNAFTSLYFHSICASVAFWFCRGSFFLALCVCFLCLFVVFPHGVAFHFSFFRLLFLLNRYLIYLKCKFSSFVYLFCMKRHGTDRWIEWN